MLQTLTECDLDLVAGGAWGISAFNYAKGSFNTGGTSVGNFNVSLTTVVKTAPYSSVTLNQNISIDINIGSHGGAANG
jgi:hypothetical protein